MDQADLELQLKVWKDLAVSKQMLIRGATDALGLDPECSAEDLKQALEVAVKRALDADGNIKKAQDQSRIASEVMQKKVSASEKSLAEAESAKSEALAAQQNTEAQIALDRESHAKELKKLKAQLAEKQKMLKDINVSLADTPENVLKKLKTLKKQKLDEANSRKRLEGEVRTLRKDKQQLEQQVKDLQENAENAAKLVEQHRELHQQCEAFRTQLEPLVEDAETLPKLAELPAELIESIENAVKKDDEK